MRFLADALTLFRLVCAFVVPILVWVDSWVVATVLFTAAIVSDALDGLAARKWPYSSDENRRFWWRRDAHAWDNAADGLLSVLVAVTVIFSLLAFWPALASLAVVGLANAGFLAGVKLTARRDVALAERIDVAHGWFYGLLLFALLVAMTVQATEAWSWVVVGYTLAAVPLLWFKRDRMMSRPEVTYRP